MKSLLDHLQRFTRTDIRYLVKGGFWTTLSYSLQVGTGLIATIALANLLPKDQLGMYQYILATAGIVSVCTLSGMGTAITRAVAQGHEGTLRSGVRTKLKWSITIVVLAGAVSSYYLLQGNVVLGISFLIVGATAPFIESFKLYENYLVGKQAFRQTVTIGFWRKPLPLIAVVSTLFITDSVIALVAAYFITNAISYVWVYFATIRHYLPPALPHSETFQFSKHLSVFRIITSVANNIDKVILWHFLGPVSVATYSIAQIVTRYTGGLINSISSVALPKIAQQNINALRLTLPRKILLLMLLMALFAAIYVASIPILFSLLFPQYLDAVLLAQILGAGFIFYPRTILGQVVTAHASIKYQYVFTLLFILIKLTSLILFVSLFGIMGAVWSLLLSEFTGFILGYMYLMTISKRKGATSDTI